MLHTHNESIMIEQDKTTWDNKSDYMKQSELLNAPLSAVVATMGHTDSLVIADAGLPIPSQPERIDLAITKNFPQFLPVLEATLTELCIERVVLAEEIKQHNDAIHQAILALLKTNHIAHIDYCSHEQFKAQTQHSKAVVRTGECSPYANILLFSGVTF